MRLELLGFSVISTLVALIYYYLSDKHEEKFLKYCGRCWLTYAASFLVVFLAVLFDVYKLLMISKLLSMFAILCFLYGAYTLSHKQVPSFWIRFAIYLVIWALLCMYMDVEDMAASIPIAVFDIVLGGGTVYSLAKTLENSTLEKVVQSLIIFTWAIVLALVAVVEAMQEYDFRIYEFEIMVAALVTIITFAENLIQYRYRMNKMRNDYETIVENAVDAIFYFRLKTGTFEYITPSIESISGYTPHDFYDNPRLILSLFTKEHVALAKDIFYADPEADYQVAPASEILQLVRKDNSLRWVALNISVIKNREGAAIALDGSISDVTTLKEARDEMAASKQARDLLFSYVSHELKTPITSILGYVKAINGGYIEKGAATDRAMKVVEQKSILLEKMIMDLFQLTQLETNQFSFQFGLVSCEELWSVIQKENKAILSTQEIDYSFDFHPSLLTKQLVVADSVRINQVISNLVDNAIKYTKARNYITVAGGVEGDCFVISVIDKGIGIPKEDLSHVFDRFFKSPDKNAKAAHGSGLGLSLSKEIVEAHNGKIEVKSKYGKGSRFTVRLPLYREE